MFNSWPGWYSVLWGATWGNQAAAVEWVIIIGSVSFLFKRYLRNAGNRLISEFHDPFKDHLEKQLLKHKEEIKNLLKQHSEYILDELKDQ